ncbi:hypothetical protein ISCGN_012606 [Ixodes scapularis]
MDKPAARLYASYYVCSDHFTVHDFMDPGRTRLTKTAVPSVRPQEHWQSVICRDLVEASTSHGTPSDSQPVTLSRAAHDLAEASTSHGTPSDSQPVTLSRAAHDLAEASTSHGTPSDSQPVTLSRAAHDLAEASTSHGTPSDSQPVTLSRAAHDLAEASTSHGTPSDSQPVTLSRAAHDLAEASTSHGTPSDSQPVTLSRAVHDLAEASTSHGTPSDSQPVTLSRAAHDLVQASSSYGTPSDLSPVTPFSSASSESAEACVMSSISTKTQSWNERDRVCTLIFDEMVLKKNLAYDVTQDVVQGFTDDGIERTSTIADRALVVLLSGISKSHPVLDSAAHLRGSELVRRLSYRRQFYIYANRPTRALIRESHPKEDVSTKSTSQ